MAYTRLNLSDGQVFNASHVSHIEDGIEDCESQLEEVNQSLTDQYDGVLGYFSTFDNLNSKVTEKSYRPILFACSGSQVSSVLTGGQWSSMGIGIAACNNSARTQWIYFLNSSSGYIYTGIVLNGEVTNVYKISTSAV